MKRMLVVIMLGVGAACGGSAPPEEAAAPPPGTPNEIAMSAQQIAHGGVRWAAVSETPVADFVELSGRLVVDADHTARLSPAVRGRVIDVRANLGDAVSRNQTLVALQSEEASDRRAELARSEAELTARRSALTFARSARERAERLLSMKAGSAQDVERARTDEASALAGVSQAETAVTHARTALSVLQVDADTGQVLLASPIGGTVVAREAMVGSVIEAGAPALTVADTSFLWLEFGAPDSVASALRPGQRVEFNTPAASAWTGARILRVNGALDAVTRLVTVRAAVANPSRSLRPELFATVRAHTSDARPGITVPHDAVQRVDERPVVFIAAPDQQGGAKFIRRDVGTGTTADGRTHIVSGLKAGDVVVTEGAFAVKSIFSRAKMPAGG